MTDTVQLKLAFGAAFLTHVQNAMSAVQRGARSGSTASLNKEVTIRTVGCRLKPQDLTALTQAATIAVDDAAASVGGRYSMTKGQVVSQLWPNTSSIVATLTFSPPNSFGWDLDLDQ